jgi:hypothetical protein
MVPSTVTLAYDGRNYTFAAEADSVIKGKLCCDCTKSLLIRDFCDHHFPPLKCGHKIEVVSMINLDPNAARN